MIKGNVKHVKAVEEQSNGSSQKLNTKLAQCKSTLCHWYLKELNVQLNDIREFAVQSSNDHNSQKIKTTPNIH